MADDVTMADDDYQTGWIAALFDRGYGFVEQDGTRRRLFVHAREAPEFESFIVGTRVRFLPTETERGPRAVDVQRLA